MVDSGPAWKRAVASRGCAKLNTGPTRPYDTLRPFAVGDPDLERTGISARRGVHVSSSANKQLSPRVRLAVDGTDWCRAPRNLLLEGPRGSTEAMLRRLAPYLRGPVEWTRHSVAFALPQGEVGALILRDVGRLGRQEQTRLLTWLDANPRTTIVCTNTRPLFGFVVRGLFDAGLYYRLNVLLLSGDIETIAHGTELDRVPRQMMARAVTHGMNINDRDHVIASTTGATFTEGDSHD
jgi:hypothetical protein